MATRDEMLAELKRVFVPALRKRGFTGSLPHLRRVSARGIDLLTVQFDRNGGGFVVEVSRCAADGLVTHWGKHIPPSKVTAHDVHPNERKRIGSADPQADDHWFRFDGGGNVQRAATDAIGSLSDADVWWAARAAAS